MKRGFSLQGGSMGGRTTKQDAFLTRTKRRILCVLGVFCFGFFVVCWRLGFLMTSSHGAGRETPSPLVAAERADITDRQGVILATNLVTQSLYANPHMVVNPEETAKALVGVFPDLPYATVLAKLKSDRGFIWLKRNLTPKQQSLVYQLGLPGVSFQKEDKRLYPHGNLFSHILGCTDVDSKGVSGVEKYFNEALTTDTAPVMLSLDARVQHVLRDELTRKIEEFSAIGGTGIIMDVNTGEVLAMVSLPDFDPHRIQEAKPEALFNMATLGVYEFGSSMKILTTALALDSGLIKLHSRYDIAEPIRVGRFKIKDYHPQKIVADIPQIFLHSSNIGMVKMIKDVGVHRHQEFLSRMGLFQPALIELFETGKPLFPTQWRDIHSMTVAYGYGLSVTALHAANAVSAVVNGGILRRATILKAEKGSEAMGVRVISEETSQKMRELLRLVVRLGTGRQANAAGYDVGGKTGTAEKAFGGHYKKANIVSFVAAFPLSNPKYLVMVMVDEPKGTKASYGFATAGWVTAPLVKNVVTRIAPILGVQPHFEEDAEDSMVEIYKASMKGH